MNLDIQTKKPGMEYRDIPKYPSRREYGGWGGVPPIRKRRSNEERGLGGISPKHQRSVCPEKPTKRSINEKN